MNRRTFTRGLGTMAVTPWLTRLGRPLSGTRALPQDPLRVNGSRLNGHLAELSAFGRGAGGTSRVAYTDADVAGRRAVMGWMREAGLSVRVDTAGNILGRREGRQADLPVILFGSHIDSVPNGGNYDGDVGSLGAIEVAHTLQEAGVTTNHPLEVVIFQNEEGGTVGSRLVTLGIRESDLDQVARSGITLRDGTRILGGDPARRDEARRQPGALTCYLELHIEQGAVLDESGIRIGVVEGIVGLRWFEVEIHGFANHAGTTPMNRRQDALLAAAHLTVAVNRIVRAMPGRQVGTVGRMTPSPGTTNVIAERVVMSLDLRDLSADTIARMEAQIREAAGRIAAETGTTMTFRQLTDSAPALCDPRIQGAIEASADRLGLSHRRMPSGAGHDAQEVAHLCPIGMIFVPSVGGISHSPKELSRPDDITAGADVLLHTVLAADGGLLD